MLRFVGRVPNPPEADEKPDIGCYVSTFAYLFRIILLLEDLQKMVVGADLDFSAALVPVGGVYRILHTGSLHLLVILSNVLSLHLTGRIGTESKVLFETAICSHHNKPLTGAPTAIILFP